jgi:hypothetical protein
MMMIEITANISMREKAAWPLRGFVCMILGCGMVGETPMRSHEDKLARGL